MSGTASVVHQDRSDDKEKVSGDMEAASIISLKAVITPRIDDKSLSSCERGSASVISLTAVMFPCADDKEKLWSD